MSLCCPNKDCKAAKGACSHEKLMISIVVIAVGILAVGKWMHWF